MQRKHVTKEEIDQFLNGNNPMERIIKLEIDYNDDKVHIFYRDEKGVKKCQIEPFYPFVWAKQSAARCLFNGDRKKIKDTLNEYGIACKGLIIDDLNGNIHPRMENGYRVLFYAKIPMSFSKFMQFFIDGGRPIYPKQGDLNYNLRDYIVVAPNEQHMISTGKRLFKGYNDYDDLIRMQWDLETEGLTPETDMISQIGIRTNKGFEKIICIDGQTREEKGEKELEGMAEFFQTIKDIDPDVITGYNTENFDWNFEDVRLKKHNSSLSEFTAPYFNGKGIYKKKKQSVLKLGGEMEYYYPTVKYGTNLTDGLFSVRRAQAIDSNMKKADLKYITKYSKLNKPNRVYVPGKIINSTWVEIDTPYAFNNANGHWFKITDKLLEKTYEIEKSKEEQDLDNFLNFNDDNTPQKIKSKLYTFNGNTLVNNQTGETFEVKNGRYIVERYLADDLWETDKVELRYNQPNFLVGKMLPVSFEKMCTMGTAAIWKYIMLAWSYEHDLAIPELIETRKFVGGLSRLLSVGYVDRIVKLDYNSLYPSIILSYDIKSPIDISGVMSALLEYILTQREYYKGLKGEYGKKAKKIKKKIESNPNIENKEALIKEQLQYEAESARNDKMQLPLKITGNGFFGSYGSGSVFPHSDIECAEMTTCIGRMCLRLMISHFNKLGYKPIVGDTDGFNFQMPNNEDIRYTEEHPYISNGKGRNSENGKAYTGVDADVAEFEDMFLCYPYTVETGNKMGLGVDEYCDATINFARKNYADLLDIKSDKIKLVGNTIKSKKMPIYIEKFLDKGIKLLLHGKGKEFLEFYYDYVEKIYNMQIPLKDIATVGKIKTSIDTYINSCKQLTAGGTKKARQAWYELAIKHSLNVHMGDAIYYINTGNKKSSSDVQRITKFYYINDNGQKVNYVTNEDGTPMTDRKGNNIDLTKQIEREYNKVKKNAPDSDFIVNGKTRKYKISLFEFGKKKYPNLQEEDVLIFNCVMLSNDIVEDEEDHFCSEDFEYNKDKYIDMFNKRIKPLLVCFDKSIRTTIDAKGKEKSNILITDPSDRRVFTEEESKLVSGQPYNATDQDTYQQLMTIEDKEIKFWLSVNKKPPYADECDINWEETVSDYNERMKRYQEEGIKAEIEEYEKIVNNFSQDDIENLIEEGILPDKLLKFAELDVKTNSFVSKKFNIKIGSLSDVFDILGESEWDEVAE